MIAVSLGLICAGTGDIEVFRILRELRWKPEEGTYGSHLAISMSLGFLFLAGGRGACLKRDSVSIGCLLLATCPRFPNRTLDHQYHLQALRHIYVLAIDTTNTNSRPVYK